MIVSVAVKATAVIVIMIAVAVIVKIMTAMMMVFRKEGEKREEGKSRSTVVIIKRHKNASLFFGLTTVYSRMDKTVIKPKK